MNTEDPVAVKMRLIELALALPGATHDGALAFAQMAYSWFQGRADEAPAKTVAEASRPLPAETPPAPEPRRLAPVARPVIEQPAPRGKPTPPPPVERRNVADLVRTQPAGGQQRERRLAAVPPTNSPGDVRLLAWRAIAKLIAAGNNDPSLGEISVTSGVKVGSIHYARGSLIGMGAIRRQEDGSLVLLKQPPADGDLGPYLRRDVTADLMGDPAPGKGAT